MMSICRHGSSKRNFPYPISPKVKTADFNVPESISLYDDGNNTGYFHTAGNEAMKPTLLLFKSFLKAGICQIVFNPIQDGKRGKVQKVPY